MPHPTQFQEGDHLDETTLRQFLNADLPSDAVLQVEGHVAACPQCRARLDTIAREGAAADTSLIALTQAFARRGFTSPLPQLNPIAQQSPDFETIAAYVEGTLSREEAAEFEALMQQRPQLAQEVAELRALKQELQSSLSHENANVAATSSFGVVPPMIVKQPSASSSPARAWWTRWRWPMQSLGMATATAALLFVLVWNPELKKSHLERVQSQQREARLKTQVEQARSEVSELQRESTQGKQKFQRLNEKVNSLTQKAKDQEKKLNALDAQNEQLRNVPDEPSRTQAPVSTPTAPVPSATSAPSSGNRQTQIVPSVPDAEEPESQPRSVSYTIQGNTMHLEGDAPTGLSEGAIIQLPNEATRGATSSKTSAHQTQITGVSGREIKVADASGVAAQGKVRVLIPSLRNKRILVGLGPGVNWNNPIIKRWKGLFTSNYFRLAYPGERPTVRLALGLRRQVPSSPDQTNKNGGPDKRGYYISSATGNPVPDSFVTARSNGEVEPDNERILEQKLASLCVQSRLLALSNPVPEGQSLLRLVKIQLYKVREHLDGKKRGNASSSPQFEPFEFSQRMQFKVGERAQFRFENQSKQTLYLYLAWLAQDGNVIAVPPSDDNSAPVMTLTPKETSGSKISTATFVFNPPTGAEKIKLFVSTRPINPAYLKIDNAKIDNAKIDNADESQPMENPSSLDGLLAQAFGKNPGTTPSPPIDFVTWASTTREIIIR